MRIRKSMRRSRWRRVLYRTAVTLTILALAIFVYALVVPLPRALHDPLSGSVRLLDREGKLLQIVASPLSRAQEPVALEQISPWLSRVTVALEDHRFYQHSGTDWHALLGAAQRNLRSRRTISGASTITQQTIKLARPPQRRSYTAKIYENFAARRLERLWSKERILEEYLNRCDYGNRLIGAEAAARGYFGKSARNLTLAEAIYLAGLPQAPTRYNPWRRPEAARARYERSLARLEALGVITAEESHHCRTEPPVIGRFLPPQLAPHFGELVQSHTARACGPVFTTLDSSLQKTCELLVAQHIKDLRPLSARQAAVVVIDNRDGAVCALVGSPDPAAAEGQINGAIISRSSGSTLKPFLYLHAIENRVVTAATLLPDTPDAVNVEFRDYDPINYDHAYRGPVRARAALGNSLNVPAVVLLGRMGARETFEYLQSWELHFARPFETYGAGLILGNGEVSLLDLTAAYAGLARGGVVISPRILREDPIQSRRVASREASGIVCDILSDNEARTLTFGRNSPLAFKSRIPCKTGTSSGYRDAWTVGSTGRHTVGVWVGNFDGAPMDEVAAIRGAAPLWRSIIDCLLEKDPPIETLKESRGLVRRRVCSLTGLRPSPGSPGQKDEWFLTGTEPTQDASDYFKLVQGRWQVVLPSDYSLWCESQFNILGAVAARDPALKILSPLSGSVLVIDPNLPRSQQQLQLHAAHVDPASATWKVDDTIVTNRNGYFLWPLAPGNHKAVVEVGSRQAETHFSVELETPVELQLKSASP